MLSRVKKFVRDIKEKRWGKEIKEVVEQHLSPFEKQDESTIYLFEKLIEDRYGVRISTNGIRWVWEEILKTLEIKRKLLQDIQTNINPSLYSLVEKYRGNFSEGRKKFTEEHFHLLYMVYTHGGFWIDKNSEIKGAFLHYLEEICNMKISKREANMVWNWISKYTKEEMQEMMRKGINLLMEIHNLGDEEISTRVNAAIKLGILGDKRAVRPLLEALKDRNMEVKIAAAEALGEIGDTRSIDDIRKLLGSIEKEINKLNKRLDRINKKSYYVGYYTEVREIEQEREIYSGFYVRVERVLKRLKKKKFQQIAKLTDGKYKELEWQDFQDRVIEALNGIPSDKKVADMGIDGFTSDGIPIQVKQSERIGRNVVDNFETALRRYYQDSDKKLLEGEFRSIQKDIRALETKQIVETLQILLSDREIKLVRSEAELEILNEYEEIVMSDDEISDWLAEKFLAEKDIVRDSIFLRWSESKSKQKSDVVPDKVVTGDELHRALMRQVVGESEKSGDWWRQTAAAVAKDGKLISIAHNTHKPSDQNQYVLGDPRANSSRGLALEVSTALHAEEAVVADALYDSASNREDIHRRWMKAYIPFRRKNRQAKGFVYDHQSDTLICPQGVRSKEVKNPQGRGKFYNFPVEICKGCTSRCQAFKGDRSRIYISDDYRLKLEDDDEFYSEAMELRKRVERKFGEAKKWHGLRRARYRGKWRVAIQGLMTFLVLNVKRMVKLLKDDQKPHPLQSKPALVTS